MQEVYKGDSLSERQDEVFEGLTPTTFLENIEDKQKLHDMVFMEYLMALSRKDLRKHLKPEARFSNRIKKALNKKK